MSSIESILYYLELYFMKKSGTNCPIPPNISMTYKFQVKELQGLGDSTLPKGLSLTHIHPISYLRDQSQGLLLVLTTTATLHYAFMHTGSNIKASGLFRRPNFEKSKNAFVFF
ncbi:hypothetical protein VNO77_40803 [Canavalia gladiata]|uniref:Uncharacterized protein n=1 Tax=Canavalia gladiata TaxID=3824 RepID=A0AAN9K1T6_CANGL